jgi:hypothetical protein
VEVIDRIDVQNDPVNWVDPWGLISAGQLGIGNPGSYGGENTCDSMYDDEDPRGDGYYGDPDVPVVRDPFIDPALILGVAKAGSSLFSKGSEFVITKEGVKILRLAPFGNRSGHAIGSFPHYHRPRFNPKRPGHDLRDQGAGRHRPWETSTVNLF